MHYHSTKYFYFDAITDEQKKQLQEIDWRYGGDTVAIGETVVGDPFLAISVCGEDAHSVFEKLVALVKEVRDIHLSGFRVAPAGDEGECDDEECVNPEAGKDIKRTN